MLACLMPMVVCCWREMKGGNSMMSSSVYRTLGCRARMACSLAFFLGTHLNCETLSISCSRIWPKNFGTVCGVTTLAWFHTSVGALGVGDPVMPHTMCLAEAR